MAREVVDILFEYGGFFSMDQNISFIARKSVGKEEGVVYLTRGIIANKYLDRKMSKEEWQEMTDTLFETIRIQDWEKSYKPDVCVMDGYQWHLRVTLADRKKYEIEGDNAVPENWDEWMDLLQPFFLEYEALPEKEAK